MARVKTKPMVDSEVEVLVEIVHDIDKKEEKSALLVEAKGFSHSKKNVLLKTRTLRPPKNLILVEGDPVDTMGVPKRREMRNFPTEDLLSAKIKMANGTDYSNHFIEQHYNRRSSGKRRFQRNSKQIGITDSLKKKKKKKKTKQKKKEVSTDDLRPDVLNKEEEVPQDIIDLADITEEEKIVKRKIVDINFTDKLDSKSNDFTVSRYRLVPYSSSDEESDDANEHSSLTISNENSTRQYLIGEGLSGEKFKFQYNTMTYGRKKKFI